MGMGIGIKRQTIGVGFIKAQEMEETTKGNAEELADNRVGIAEEIKGGPNSGNHGHAGRPGHIGGSKPGGGKAGKSKPKPKVASASSSSSSIITSPSQLDPISSKDAGKGKFSWSMKGARGSYTATFRFMDESRGERFFDSEFSIGFRSAKGYMEIGNEVGYRGYPTANTPYSSGLANAMKPGTTLLIYPQKNTPRGKRGENPISVTIKKRGVGQNEWFGVAYDENRK